MSATSLPVTVEVEEHNSLAVVRDVNGLGIAVVHADNAEEFARMVNAFAALRAVAEEWLEECDLDDEGHFPPALKALDTLFPDWRTWTP